MAQQVSKEKRCGEVYSNLWEHYKGNLFADYCKWLWYEVNQYDVWLDPELEGKIVLDAGFGSGRAIAAILNAGAEKVYGIDISPKNEAIAKENLSPWISKVNLKTGSVLDLPYDDEFFDVVHCYGVLHHTSNPRKGYDELVRVLKTDGVLFIALYSKGGLVNHVLNFFRFFTTRGFPPFGAMKAFSRAIFGEDKNHFWYAILDGLYAPYRETYTEKELRDWLDSTGIKNVSRYYCSWSYYKWPKLLSGKDRGLIILKGYKRKV